MTQTRSTQTSSLAAPGTLAGLENDVEAARIVAEELKLLWTVQRALESSAGAGAAASQGRALDDRRLLELRDDVAVAKPEDLPALFEQMHNLGALRAQRGRSIAGSVDRATPYFGHMRLEESVAPGHASAAGSPKRRRDVLIGARSYVDSGEGIRIVDWRQAPVSRLYYRYDEGDDYEEELGDRIVEGSVVVRRGVSIVAGELVRVAAPQGTFVRGRDGAWKRVAIRRAQLETEKAWSARRGIAGEARLGVGVDGELRQDKHLPAIAALLDERQFGIIAKESAGLIAIQGSAGSGKTTVGMHRVAYLAFSEPQRFRPEKMLVIVPNEALVHYVSRVLPSLGVEGVAVTTFGRFGARLVEQMFPKLPSRTTEETPPVVSRAKSHAAMLRGLDRLVGRIARDVDTRIRAAMAHWPSGDRVTSAWEATERAVHPDEVAPPDTRLALLLQWAAGKRRLPGDAVAAAIPEVTRSALEQLVGQLRSSTRSVAGVWDELLTSREALAETFSGVGGFGPGQLEQVQAWCVRQARVRAEGERDGEEPSLDAEDPALLLRCWQVLRGPLLDAEAKPIRFAHVFVDEVQDASPIELRILMDLAGRERCITLAGDVAQRMLDDGDDRGEFDWDALLDGLGVPHTKIEPLKVSYRSTTEITAFARAILGPLAHGEVPEATRRGPPVELFTFASPGESVAWLAEVCKQLARDEPEANVALVARFPQQADLYYEGLVRAELPNIRRVAKQDFSWDAGIDVTDVRQTKGLEFDEVILLETTAASYPSTPTARHALYVGATRASHQLWCVASDEPSRLVSDAIGPESKGSD
ncbi:MAG: ATP-binding domain-containing protein [Myxococcota bacterium]|nr:ATP-binding domain-containing protein [Myxococcota bacterium]